MENQKNNNLIEKYRAKKSVVVLSFIGLFLVSVGISLVVFYYISPKSAASLLSGISKKTNVKVNLPKTEECPINGGMYTKVDKETWEGRRPIAAIIENHIDARPEFGLSSADVVYEAVAEGGITRFLSIFYCEASEGDVLASPIRSARVYFINMAAGYGSNPIFLHYGGANDFCPKCPGGVKEKGVINSLVNAYDLLDKLGWANGKFGNDMDGQTNYGYPGLIREVNRLGADITLADEHSVVAYLDTVWKNAAERGYNYKDSEGTPWTEGFRKWLFQDGSNNPSPKASDIKFNFWDSMPGYDVEWKYDNNTNAYARFNNSRSFIDYTANKSQIYAKNVVLMFVDEKTGIDKEGHVYYTVTGTGKSIVFQNGEAIKGTWEKKTALDREVFYDTNGDEIKMVRGATWVELIPSTNQVAY